MKSIVNYYYNFFPDTINKKYGGFYFVDKNNMYLLIELLIEPDELLFIYEKLMAYKISNYIIIYNKDNSIITSYNEKKYILFVINCNPNEIIKFNEQIFIQIDREANWSELWSNRIDYYEVQINELELNKNIVLHSVQYYIGLAENAISIANNFEININEECSIQHYRMPVPITKGDYFNPGNMIVDISIRDAAEYIKSSFFIEKRDINYYIDYIKNMHLTDLTANLFLARLLYPTYYFDLFDDIILNDRNENDLIDIINFQQSYENLLKDIYDLFMRNFQMININWLRKRTIIQH